MDLHMLEHAAEVIFRMCREHPEICPHDYSWRTSTDLGNGKYEVEYVCSLCGNVMVRVQDRSM